MLLLLSFFVFFSLWVSCLLNDDILTPLFFSFSMCISLFLFFHSILWFKIQRKNLSIFFMLLSCLGYLFAYLSVHAMCLSVHMSGFISYELWMQLIDKTEITYGHNRRTYRLSLFFFLWKIYHVHTISNECINRGQTKSFKRLTCGLLNIHTYVGKTHFFLNYLA